MSEDKLMIVSNKSLFTGSEENLEYDGDKVIIILEGTLVIDVQKCGSCRPKTIGLTKRGSHVYIPRNTAHRIRNRGLIRAWYIEVITNCHQSD